MFIIFKLHCYKLILLVQGKTESYMDFFFLIEVEGCNPHILNVNGLLSCVKGIEQMWRCYVHM